MALKHILLITAVAGLVLGVPVILATGAFTTATLEREATVNVASDSEGLLALIDGHQGPDQTIVVEKSDGTLAIDLTPGDAAGVNEDATFLVGSKSNAPGDHAFEVRNQGTRTVGITVKYKLSSGTDPSGVQNVKFTFYDGENNPLTTASEQSTGNIETLDPATSVYVVIEINTNGIQDGKDLSGALDISADV